MVYFDETLYDNLSETDRPTGWSSLIVPPSAVLGDDGEYDAYVSGPELAVGESVSGFVVRFEWLGLDEPSIQPFEILDATTFASIYSGTTTKAVLTRIQAIPSSSLTALIILLMLVLSICYQKTKQYLNHKRGEL